MRIRALLLLLLVGGLDASAQELKEFPPAALGDTSQYGRYVQRTMRLLATSTPEHRETVRILFYGQSITEQGWWKLVAEDLRRRFPDANLLIENKAIGGHASQMLVKTAEADLYPFYPDLLIFHVYGAHNTYEDILRRVRERTTAEILQQNDHVTKPEDFAEETDPSKLAPGHGSWDAFMNHNWLPSLSRKYGTEFCDQRAVWKQYLLGNHFEPKELLKDGVHLNPHGEALMAQIVSAHLRYDARLGPGDAENWVKTLKMNQDLKWNGGKLLTAFEGNRIDAVATGASAEPWRVLIDGQPPSAFPGVYSFSRTSAYPNSSWPCLLKVGSEKPLQVEEWTLTLHDLSPDLKAFKFDLEGSKTGPDGSGNAGQRFVSNSGRVVIDPADWNLPFCLTVFKQPLPEGFQVKWKVEPHFKDELSIPASGNAAIENIVTLAQGLPNGPHTLEISGRGEPPISALRVYAPPLK